MIDNLSEKAATTRQAKIERAMLCSLCRHDWFDHDFDHPASGGVPCRDCEGSVCRDPQR